MALCRQEARRLWQPSTITAAIVTLAAILAGQWALAVAALGRVSHGRELASILGAKIHPYSHLGWSYVSQFPGPTVVYIADYQEYRWATAAVAAPMAAACFIMPAFAALSVAPLRARGRVPELALAGYTPWRILAASGLAGLGPFVALALVGIGASLSAFHAVPHPEEEIWRTAVTRIGLGGLWHAPLSILSSACVLLCVSALCRRMSTAIAACYVTQLLALPGLMRVIEASRTTTYLADLSRPDCWLNWIPYVPLIAVAAQFAALLVLFPLAARALRYPRRDPA